MRNKTIVKGIIFDMDGLIIDSERIARLTWIQAAAEFDYTMTESEYFQVSGRTVPDAEIVFKKIYGTDFPFSEIRARRVALTEAFYEKNGIPVKPGVPELLDVLEEKKIPRAVATSSDFKTAANKLTRTNLIHRFHGMVTGDQVKNGKPAPDIFLAAAQKINIAPEYCVVLEDSEAGIRGAHAAGMLPIMVPDGKAPTAEMQQLAWRIESSLHEVRAFLFSA